MNIGEGLETGEMKIDELVGIEEMRVVCADDPLQALGE